MFKMFVILPLVSIIISTCLAEAPLPNRAPYPPSGWRPQRPFALPGRYLPPSRHHPNHHSQGPSGYEITRQRVDYAGGETYRLPAQQQPHSNYLPPPHQRQPTFINIQRHNDLYQDQPHYQQHYQQFEEETQTQNSFLNNIQEEPQPQVQTPLVTYGVPKTNNTQQQQQLQINTEDLQKLQALQALNYALENYNKLQDSNNNNNNVNVGQAITKGQYFVLNPDNTIQQVSYTTTQDENEAKSQDFTAQLKYTKVGELNDPLYKYSELGQLVRVVKK
ncbi:uncharacterized protein ACN427_003131 [Glossina fuscipes fuscipes]